jgi:ubiquinone/menaquinone biosynthesis C-methylase UbiE
MVNQEAGRSVTLSFEKIAPVYDATRRMSDAVCIEISREICAEAGNREGMLVADVGAGTGRFSVPLTVRGCRVVGVDVSREMLRVMLSKVNRDFHCRLQPLVADARNLPFRSNCFDAALCFQVLHLIQEWHSAISEAQRTLVKRGLLAVGESARKGLTAEIGDAYKEIRDKQGYPYVRPGARSIEEVLDFLRNKRFTVSSEPEKHTWIGRLTINSIIQGLEDKVYSGTWNVPQEAHREVILELREWARKRYSNLELSREIESEFKIGFARFSETRTKK